jgi:sugar O-acyltransferase (sialic acid O-acetyltransferase NeuD family)
MLTDTDIIFFGAGGHAKVVFDALQASDGEHPGLTVVDDNPALVGQDFFGIPVQRGDACEQLARFRFHVAIGRNAVRQAVFARLRGWGGLPLTVLHPRAQVSPHARVGEGGFLAAGCVVAPASVIGEGVIVNHAAVVDHDCQVGAYSHIAPNVTLGGNVRIGTGVLVGAAAVILPGVTVGDGCIVGAGAVVIANLPAATTVVGVRAGMPRRGNAP